MYVGAVVFGGMLDAQVSGEKQLQLFKWGMGWLLVVFVVFGMMGCPSDPPKEPTPQDASEVAQPDKARPKDDKTSPDDRTADAPSPDVSPDTGDPDAPGDAGPPETPSDAGNPDSVPNAAAILLMEDGNYQRGEVGKPLLKPLTVRYIDRFEKGVEGIEVVFSVLQGGGTLDGNKETSVTVKTDKDGRASTLLYLGDAQGFQRQVVQVEKKDDATKKRTFVASGFVAGPPEQTAFSGVVIDNKAQPLAGVDVYLVSNNKKSPVVKTDKDGRYTLTGLKDFVGQAHLVIDGTTEPSKDLYPKLEYEVFNIAGIDNRLDGPASLPKLDPAGTVQIDEAKTAEVKPTSIPELRMVVAAGSVTFSDKKKSGNINITSVDPYWIPMPPPNGYASSTVVTIQPSDVRFDPPAPITFPNTDKLPPGKIVPILSFDHAKGRYVKVADARVSADGKSVSSLPGQGIVRGGWHITSQIAPTETTVTNVENKKKKPVGEVIGETTDNKRFVKSKSQTNGCTKTAGDPISLCGGAFTVSLTDLFVPARGISFRFTRTYNSKIRFHGALGHNWDHNYNMRLLIKGNGDVELVNGGGRADLFSYDAAKKEFASPPNSYTQLTRLQNGNYILKWRQGRLGTFDSQGVLRKIEDRFGNTLQFRYNLKGQLSEVIDPVGRSYVYTYDEAGHLIRLTDFAGRVVSFVYDDNDDLVSVTTPSTARYPKGKTVQYTYAKDQSDRALAHNLLTMADAKGKVYVTNKYDAEDRVSEQVYGPGTFKISYQEANQNGDPKDLALVRHITTMTDPENNVVKYHFNINGNAVKTERLSRKLRPTDPASWVQTATYNAQGRPLTITYPNGNSLIYTYDTTSNNPLDRGNVLSMEWKSHRSQDTHKSIKRTYTYESRYQLLKSAVGPRGTCTGCDANKYKTSYFYDYEEKSGGDLNGDGKTDGDKGFLVKVVLPTTTLPDGKTQTREHKYVPNAFGQIAQSIDPMGIVTEYKYFGASGANNAFDSEGYLKEVVKDPKGLKITSSYLYNALGNVTSYTDPRGHVSRYHYNQRRQLVASISPAPFLYKTFYRYDLNDKLELIQRENKDHDNKQIAEHPYLQTKLIRNVLDRVIERHIEESPNRWLITKIERDKMQRITKVTKPEGNSKCIEYDERSLVLSETLACASASAVKTTYDYDKNANLTSKKLANGEVHQRFYDGHDRVSRFADPVGSSVEYTYDEAGNAVEVTSLGAHGGKKDVVLAKRETAYDAAGRPITSTSHLFDAPGSAVTKLKTQYFYDPNGSMSKIIDARNHTWNFGYDSAHRLKERFDPEGNGVRFVRDAGGLITQKTVVSKSSKSGVADRTYVIDYTHDSIGRLTSRKNALGHTRRFGYNSRNALTQHIDQEGEIKRLAYDGAGRLTQKTSVLRQGGVVTGEQVFKLVWDGNGRLRSWTTPKGNTYGMAYNALGRVTTMTYPTVGGTAATSTFTYDTNGRVKTITDPNKTVSSIIYDAADRVTRINLQRAAGIIGATFQSFKYDGLHRVIEGKNDHSTVTLTYDSLSRLRKDANGTKGMEANYDAVGNRIFLKYPSGVEVTNTYDKANRLRTVTRKGQTKPVAVFDYIGKTMVRKEMASGVTLVRTLDTVGRIATHAYQSATQQILKGYRYGYNKANKRVFKQELHGAKPTAQVNHYDSLYRVVGVAYGVTDPQKELATPGSQTTTQRVGYTYDIDNNRKQVTSTGSGLTFPVVVGNYTTNARNHYTKIGNASRTHDANGNLTKDGARTFAFNAANQLIQSGGAGTQQTRRFDAFGRLIKQTGGSLSANADYSYLGRRAYEAFIRANKNQTNILGRRGEIISSTQSNQQRDVATDMKGSVMAFFQPSGAIDVQINYSKEGAPLLLNAAGQAINAATAGVAPLFTFRGAIDNSNGTAIGAGGFNPGTMREARLDNPNSPGRILRRPSGTPSLNRYSQGRGVFAGPKFSDTYLRSFRGGKNLGDALQDDFRQKIQRALKQQSIQDLIAKDETSERATQSGMAAPKPDPVPQVINVGPCPKDKIFSFPQGGSTAAPPKAQDDKPKRINSEPPSESFEPRHVTSDADDFISALARGAQLGGFRRKLSSSDTKRDKDKIKSFYHASRIEALSDLYTDFETYEEFPFLEKVISLSFGRRLFGQFEKELQIQERTRARENANLGTDGDLIELGDGEEVL